MQAIGDEPGDIVEPKGCQHDLLDRRSGIANRLQRPQKRVRGAVGAEDLKLMINRERLILKIEPEAILWLRRVVLYSSIGLPQAEFTNALTLGAICVRQRTYRSNDELFRYTFGK
jgi:hypothetical protein